MQQMTLTRDSIALQQPISREGEEEIELAWHEKFFTVLVIFLPFTMQYTSPVPIISFGEFCLLPFMIAYLAQDIKNGRKIIGKYCGLYTYLGLTIFLSLVVAGAPYFDNEKFLNSFARILFIGILICAAIPRFNLRYAMKYAVPAAIFFSIYLIVQWVSGTYSRIYLPITLNDGLILRSELSENRLDIEYLYSRLFRPSSLFLEPSYFVFFVATPLIYSLSSRVKRIKSMLIGLLITIALVLSTATSGLIVIVIGWAGYILSASEIDPKRGLVFQPVYLLIAIALIFIVASLATSSLAESLIYRTTSGGSSGGRLLRGLIIYSQFDFQEKLLGIGANNLGAFVGYTGISTPYDFEVRSNLGFISCLNSTFVNTGVFGFLSFVYLIISLLRHFSTDVVPSKRLFAYLFWLQMMALFTYTSIQYSSKFAYLIIIAFALIHEVQNARDRENAQESSEQTHES